MGQDKTSRTSFTAGHFEFQIDGHEPMSYLKNIDGGWAKAAVMDEAVGSDLHHIKHTSVVEIDPFSLEFGLAGAEPVLKWIQDSWRKDWGRRNGQITHANFDLFKTFEHEFFDALILETTFPAVDGAAKEAAYMKVKIQPERVNTKRVDSNDKVTPRIGQKQKMWLANSFRFVIDGMDDMQYANKIESFTVKQGIKKMWTGEDRLPQIEPTKIEFPHITGTISLGYADQLLKWYDEAVVKGMKAPRAQKSGGLEFLSPDKKSVLFRVNMYEIGILSAQIQQASANQDAIKRVKFELHVGRMDIDGHNTLGFE